MLPIINSILDLINYFFMENNITSQNQTMPENHMGLAITGLILGFCSPCCSGFILGIIAVVMATQVKSKFGKNDFSGAESSSKNAKILALIAIGLFLLNVIFVSLNWNDYSNQIQIISEQINNL